MSQSIWGTIVPSTTSGNQLAVYLNDFKSAVVSGFTGTSRPTQLEAGGYWIDTTLESTQNIWEYKIWTGTTNITLMQINLATGAPSVTGSDSTFEISKISADSVGPILKLVKERIANSGQLLDGDTVGEVRFISAADDNSNPITGSIKVVAKGNATATNSASYLVFEATETATPSKVEMMRLVDFKLGLGTTAPEATVHVKGEAEEFRGERVTDDAFGSTHVFKKKRATGVGQVISADVIANIAALSTDDTGTEVLAADIKVSATETHTSTAQGSKVTIRTKKNGETALQDVATFEGDTATLPKLASTTASIGTLTVATLNATTTNLGTVVETGDAQIVLNKGGNQAAANAVNSGFKVEMSDATHFQIGYDSTKTSKVVAGETGSLKELINTDGAQALSNKAVTLSDIDGGTASNTSRITIPKNTSTNLNGLTRKQGTFVYDTTQNKPFYDDGSQLKSIGAVAPWANGAGYATNDVITYNDKLWIAKNSFTSTTFLTDLQSGNWALLNKTDDILQVGDTAEAGSGWNSFSISGYTAGTFPTSAPTVGGSIPTTTSGAINGAASAQLLYAGAVGAGGGAISGSVLIRDKHQGKVLSVTLDYKFTAGASACTFSGTSTNTFHAVIWDETNSVWIQPNNTYGIVQASGVGTLSISFQTPINMTNFKVAILAANNAASSGLSLLFDDVVIKKQVAPTGAVVTDWQTYTPTFTGFGTATSIQFQHRRVGSNIEIRGKFTTGTTTATEARISLPSGLTSGDTNLIPSISYAGTNVRSTTTTGPGTWDVLIEPSVQYLTFGIFSANFGGLTKLQGTDLAGSGVTFSFNASVPILGWSSGVTMSSDNSGRPISFQGNKLTTQNSVTANTVDITYSTTKDTIGSWNGSQYIIPEPGDYVFTLSGSSSAGTTLVAYINGSVYKQIGDFSNLTNNVVSIMIPNLIAGQAISFRSSVTVNINGGALPAPSGLSIFKISNPSAIAKSDDIIAIYTDTSGATINVAQTVFKYTTKVKDTHSAYNTSTGIFTAPEPGTYRVTYTLALGGSLSLSTAERFATYVLVNGAGITATKLPGNGVATSMFLTQSVDYPVLAGQSIQIQAASSQAQAALSTAGFNSLSIMKVGNY